jgi:uncharacterized protein YijF (DUF1287 family)
MKKNILRAFLLFGFVSSGYGQTSFYSRLADSTLVLTKERIQYDPGYYVIDYPDGDIPSDKGVCTDVIIRAYRKIGIDLQKEVHEDMSANFELYPKKWGLSKPDKNIDHRRVPNLMTFFKRFGVSKEISSDPNDYIPGDIVCWDLGNGINHIGIVVNEKSRDGRRNLVVHNIGAGQVVEDLLFRYKVIGHFQYKK